MESTDRKAFLLQKRRIPVPKTALRTGVEMSLEFDLGAIQISEIAPWGVKNREADENKKFAIELQQALVSDSVQNKNSEESSSRGEESGAATDDTSMDLIITLIWSGNVNQETTPKVSGEGLLTIAKLCGPDAKLIFETKATAGIVLTGEFEVGTDLKQEEGEIFCKSRNFLAQVTLKQWMTSSHGNRQESAPWSIIVSSSGPLITQIADDFQKGSGVPLIINQRILDNAAVSADMMILSSQGESFPCHKLFLKESSTVFAAMLESTFEEANTGQMQLDMEDETVRAFLSFLYIGDFQAPFLKPEIAFDLLETGHKYDIPPMVSVMRRILVRTPSRVMSVKFALKMYSFGSNVADFDDMKTKAVTVIKSKPNEFNGSKEYLKTIFQDVGSAVDFMVEINSA